MRRPVGRRHTLDETLALVQRKGCKVRMLPAQTLALATVLVPDPAELGIKSWGALDYLQHVHGYLVSLNGGGK